MLTEDFDLFTRMAALGSISQAAKEANLSVSVASSRLHRLEQSLGLRLFHRTIWQLHLTQEGAVLLQQGFPLLEQFNSLLGQFQPEPQQLSGTLKITCSEVFGNRILGPVFAAFANLHPTLTLDIEQTDQNLDLVSAGIDVAIRIGQLEDSSLIAKPLSLNRRILCASPSYIKQHGEPRSLEELSMLQCILQKYPKGVSQHWTFFQDQHSIKIPVSGQFHINSGEGVRQAALAGLGISNHSIWHVEDDLQSGRLIQVLPAIPVQSTAIYVVIPHRHFVPPKVQAFMQHLDDFFQHQYAWYVSPNLSKN
ncbi:MULTISPECIES: LysR family transcriptional regulator [unclassified Acinetobacter]|uniref:LysR family transcriptional regulator n=1 Tax=unclassified Acinetobacter TaxID=196816 RepID=UPI0015D21F12|nr:MULTISPECIES: LysR family transcriptional regulator [unclassified Acinetobacter]